MNAHHMGIHTHTHIYLWFQFLSPDPQRRPLWYPPAKLLFPPDSFRIPALHQQQAVLVDCPTEHLTAPGRRPGWARQRSALGIWLLAAPYDTGTCMAGAASFPWQHPEETVLSGPRCPELPDFPLFQRLATVRLSLWILWPASHGHPTHHYYTVEADAQRG